MTFDLYPEAGTKFLEAIAYYENCAPRLGAGLRKPADPKKAAEHRVQSNVYEMPEPVERDKQ
jgi:hypothetical protein